MEDMVWEDPPPSKSNRVGVTLAFVEGLKQHPGKWARYPKSVKHNSSTTSRAKVYPGTEWTARQIEGGLYGLWARYIGENGEHA